MYLHNDYDTVRGLFSACFRFRKVIDDPRLRNPSDLGLLAHAELEVVFTT